MDTKKAYIVVEAEITCMSREFSPSDLQAIGEFTRENIANWLDGGWRYRNIDFFEVGVYGWVSFHAVCGDIDIWGTKAKRNVVGA